MEVSEGAGVDAGAGAASPVQAPIRKVVTNNTAKKRAVLTKSSECYHLQLVISGPPGRGDITDLRDLHHSGWSELPQDRESQDNSVT